MADKQTSHDRQCEEIMVLQDIRAVVEPIPGKLMQDELVAAIRGIVEERDRLRAVLQHIADQHTSDQMDSVIHHYADFEDKYDTFIRQAREALKGCGGE